MVNKFLAKFPAKHYWQVNVTNQTYSDISDIWEFNLKENQAPFVLNNEPNYPKHNSQDIKLDPTLNVTVIDPEGTNMNVTFYGREKNNTNFTIVAIPDTQHYSDSDTRWVIFKNQTLWINNSKDDLNIVFVTHEGDITQNYNDPAYEIEWQRANQSMSVLDNWVPYGVLPGNHDMSRNTAGENTDLYNKYFNYTRYEGVYDWYRGHYDRNDNNYQFFSAGGQDFIVIHIEYRANGADLLARRPVFTWANNTLEAYPNRSAIITTHEYLDFNNARTPFGNELWDHVIKTHSNVFLVLAGHNHDTDDGEARRDNINNFGKPVYQIMADYQEFFDIAPLYPTLQYQSGLLRIMKFAPAEKKIYVKTYSPYLNQNQCNDAGSDNYRWNNNAIIEPVGCYRNQIDAEFNFDYTPFNYLNQTSNVESGDNATYLWKDRKASTTYEWFVEVVDSDRMKNISQVWNFTTTS